MSKHKEPGSYTGKSLTSAKRPRKPKDFVVRGECIARCHVNKWNNHRRTIWLVGNRDLNPAQARRYATWVASAADWMEAQHGK